MKRLIDQLRDNHQLSPDGYWTLLTMHHPDDVEYLMLQAREVAQRQFVNSPMCAATIASIVASGVATLMSLDTHSPVNK